MIRQHLPVASGRGVAAHDHALAARQRAVFTLALGQSAVELAGALPPGCEVEKEIIEGEEPRRALTHDRPVAAPAPLSWFRAEPRPHRVPDDVGGGCEKMLVALDQDGPVAALEEVPVPSVAAVEGCAYTPFRSRMPRARLGCGVRTSRW